MKFGHFTAEALQQFAEAKGLDTKNQDFSEGVFDFKICEKPDGKFYGIPNQAKCKAPNKEATSRPDTGFLGSKQGRAINYDTAKGQGDVKTQQKTAADAAAKKKADDEAKAAAAAAAEVEARLKEVADRFKSMADELKAQQKKDDADNDAKMKKYLQSDISPEERAAAEMTLKAIEKMKREQPAMFGL